MAALFKVARHDKPTERKAVKAASIEGLISAAKIKLKLTDENYKLYTDDFTEIDEDEILMDMAKSKGSDQLLVTIVPEEIPWNGSILPETSSPLSSEVQKETAPKASSSNQKDISSSTSSSLSGRPDHLTKIFPKFATNVQTSLRTGLSLSPRSRKGMVHTVRDYLLNDLKDISRKTTQSISQQIVDTYKKTFTTKISNQSTDGQVESLRQAIYHAAHYVSGQSGDGNEKHDNLDDDDLTIDKPKAQDEYGCVAYLPAPPKSKVLASLEDERLKLIDIFKTEKEDIDEKIIESMDECYYLQRKQIHTEKELSVIFEHWPYFHNGKLIIKHANQLLGKNIYSIWKLSLQKLNKPINRFSKNGEIAREVAANKKKSKADADEEAESKYVRSTLKLAKQYSDNLKTEEPYEAVVFAFITKFMKENLNFLYVLTDEELTDEELLERVPVANPVLMIRGKDLHDSENTYHVVINKSIMIHVPAFTEGILTTFLCYYVFSIVYPSEIEGTLEAIQRLFLEINPEKGTKRGGKRKGTKIHPKVSRLMKDIDPYIID